MDNGKFVISLDFEIIDQVWYYVLTDKEVERIRRVVNEHIQQE